ARIGAREQNARKRSEENLRRKRTANKTRCNRRLAAFCISLDVPKSRAVALRFWTTAEKSRCQRLQNNSTRAASSRPRNRRLIFPACLAVHCSARPVSRQPDQGLLTVEGWGSH